MKLRNLKNQKFNQLTVIERVSMGRNKITRWLCKCSCGNEIILSMDHLTRKKNPVKSCGCYKKTIKGKLHHQWKGYEEISGHWWSQHIIRSGVARIKVDCTITKRYAWKLFLKQNRKCALSGINLIISNISLENTASIDRIDSSKGYIPGNIQWVHKDVNFMKRTYDQNYFIKFCKLIANFSSGVCDV